MIDEPTTVVGTSVRVPRWVKLEQFLEDACDNLKLSLGSGTGYKGWIYRTVFFSVAGPESRVRKFSHKFNEFIAESNRGWFKVKCNPLGN